MILALGLFKEMLPDCCLALNWTSGNVAFLAICNKTMPCFMDSVIPIAFSAISSYFVFASEDVSGSSKLINFHWKLDNQRYFYFDIWSEKKIYSLFHLQVLQELIFKSSKEFQVSLVFCPGYCNSQDKRPKTLEIL